MPRYRAVCLFVALLPYVAKSAESTFDFRDPKEINALTFLLDAPLEPIAGWARGISGAVRFDPEAPSKMTGKIVVDTATLTVASVLMTEHLRSEAWLGATRHPTIEFVFKRVTDMLSPSPNVFELTVVGDFSCHGVTKELTIPIQARFLPGKFRSRYRSPGPDGDLLILRSDFTIHRSDFGIKPGAMTELVAEEIQIRVSIVGGNVDPSKDEK